MADPEDAASDSSTEFTVVKRNSVFLGNLPTSRCTATGQSAPSTSNVLPLSEMKFSATPELLSGKRKADSAMNADVSRERPIRFNSKRVKVEIIPLEDETSPVTPVSTQAESMAIPTHPSDSSPGELTELSTLRISDYLDLVRDQPLIWDNDHADYKKRKLVQDAWEEIVATLQEKENVHTTVDCVKKQWKNTRKAFKLAMKNYVQGRHVSFKHFNECQFLIPRDQLDQFMAFTEKGQNDASLNISKSHLRAFSPIDASTTGFSRDVSDINPIDWVKTLIAQREAQPDDGNQLVNESAALPDYTTRPDDLETTGDYFHHFGMFVASYLRSAPIEESARLINEVTGRLMGAGTQ